MYMNSIQPVKQIIPKSKSVQIASRFGTTMTKSRIIQRSQYPQNDHLYNPLRNIVNSNPTVLNLQQHNHLNALQSSQVSRQYRPITDRQFLNIRNNTYMIDKPLRPTDHIQKVEGKKFVILHSAQKIGQPINQSQLTNRIAHSRQQILVYQPSETQNSNLHQQSAINFNQQLYIPNIAYPKDNCSKKINKYNLYSCLDQPFQRIKRNGCQNFQHCPENQCIASGNQRDWFS